MTSNRLDDQQQALLCDLADPQAPAPTARQLACLNPDDLIDLARHHAIEAIVWRKLAESPCLPGVSWARAVEMLAEQVRIATGVTLMLEAHARRITATLRERALPHRLVKGADFATALFPRPSDRPFTDIDILVPVEALGGVDTVLGEAGYDLAHDTSPGRAERSREQKWTQAGNPHLLIEVHTDLVHLPGLRRRTTYGYAEAGIADRDGTSPASGRLLTAVVHGAIGHKFHQLKLAVDVLQAMRHAVGDMPQAVTAAAQLGLTYELAASAELVRRLFPAAAADDRIAVLAALAATPGWLDRDTVVNAHRRADLRSRLRRHAFRWHQQWRGDKRS